MNRIRCKTSQKLHTLSRVAKCISEDKTCMLFKSFRISKFSYCPIVLMCNCRGLNNKIDNIHEGALRIIYQNRKFNFGNPIKNGLSWEMIK